MMAGIHSKKNAAMTQKGFADPDLFDLIEAKEHKYVIHLKSNDRL